MNLLIYGWEKMGQVSLCFLGYELDIQESFNPRYKILNPIFTFQFAIMYFLSMFLYVPFFLIKLVKRLFLIVSSTTWQIFYIFVGVTIPKCIKTRKNYTYISIYFICKLAGNKTIIKYISSNLTNL